MNKYDRIIERTSLKISNALDKMVDDLRENEAPQGALECVVVRLVELQPFFMRLIMEDADLRETYWAAVARLPATV